MYEWFSLSKKVKCQLIPISFWIFFNLPKGWKCQKNSCNCASFPRSLLVIHHDFMVKNQTAVKTVEGCSVTLPKSSSSEVKLQGSSHLFFFNVRGVVHLEFILPGWTFSRGFYLEVLRRLPNNLWQKCPVCGRWVVTGLFTVTIICSHSSLITLIFNFKKTTWFPCPSFSHLI